MAIVQTLDRGLELLEALFSQGARLTLSELARLVGRDKASVHRMLATLESRGYVVREPGRRGYSPGPKVCELAGAFGAQRDMRRAARQYLERLTASTGETSHLAVLVGREAVLVDHVVSPQRMGVTAQTGGQEPLHATALGKALAAHLPAETLDKLLDGYDCPRFTARTITTTEALRGELARVRNRGWAMDDQEYSEGIRCIAAPVFDFTGRTVGAIGISGPASRLGKRTLPALGRSVRDLALDLSRQLGFQPRGETKDD